MEKVFGEKKFVSDYSDILDNKDNFKFSGLMYVISIAR